jgi:hypothetical protein
MMWDQLMARIITLITTDVGIVEIYGDRIRMSGSSEFEDPVLEWTMIGDSETELWAPMIIQFDQWTLNADTLWKSEFRLRGLFHHDLPIIIDGVQLWTQYQDGTIIAMPDRHNQFGRAIRFRFTPLRRQYALEGVGPV